MIHREHSHCFLFFTKSRGSFYCGRGRALDEMRSRTFSQPLVHFPLPPSLPSNFPSIHPSFLPISIHLSFFLCCFNQLFYFQFSAGHWGYQKTHQNPKPTPQTNINTNPGPEGSEITSQGADTGTASGNRAGEGHEPQKGRKLQLYS